MWARICARRWENASIHSRGTPVEVGVAVGDRVAPDAEPAGELVAQVGLVEVPAVLACAYSRRESSVRQIAVVDGAGEVGDQHVGVQQRVARPRGAVPERRADEPLHLDRLGPAGAAAGPDRLALEVAERGGDRGVVRFADLLGDLAVVAEAHSSDTDFGARNVRSNPGTLRAGCAARRSPVEGWSPASTAASSAASTRPSRPSGSAPRPSHRPGASPRAR